jgi:co-chaperonin GroES (HSP10)
MVLRTGVSVDDSMNDRFYFAKYDDTNDKVDNPTWKIVSMKEIVNNGE